MVMSPEHNKKGFSGLLSFTSDPDEAVGGQNKHEHPQRPRKSITKPGPALLHMAVWLGRAEEIKELLSAGAQLDDKDEKGRTPFDIAVRRGHGEEIKKLLSANIQPDSRDEEGWTPLHLAALLGKVEAIKALLTAGAQLDARNKYGSTPLHKAASGGKVEAIKALLSAGAQLDARDKNGETPLHIAVWHGKVEAIKALLTADARLDATDKNGETPLHIAVRRGQVETIKQLLSAGAQLDARDEKGRTPLYIAAQMGHVGAIKELLSAGAQLDARNKYGSTPLHKAASGGKVEAIKALLSAGAQLDARDKNGETPLHIAVRRRHGKEIKQLLSGDGQVSARGVSLAFRLLARLFIPGVLLLLVSYCSQQDSDKTSTASSYTQSSPSAQYSPSQTPEVQGSDLELEFSQPPVGDDNPLSIAQIRWCLREDIRIEALRPMATTNPQIDQFNLVVDNYNHRCGSYRYHEDTLTRAQQELETMRPQIVAEYSPSQTPEVQGADLELKFSEPPVGDDNVLSIAQIRWCLREDIRIEVLRPMATTNPQIDQFNLVVNNYNRRCGSYRYYEGTLTRAQQELETMRPQIVAEASLY